MLILLVSLFGAVSARAETAPVEHVAISMRAGESYVVNDVAPGSSPAVNVNRNARALSIAADPAGKLTLLGAEPGDWTITVALRDGRRVAYDVTVKSRIDIEHPLRPRDAPPAIVDSGAGSGPAAPVVVKSLDAGAGPIDSSPRGAAPTPDTTGMITIPAGAHSSASSGAAPPASPSSESPGTVAPVRSGSVVRPQLSAQHGGDFITDPAVAATGADYWSPSVDGGKNYLPEDGLALMTGTSRIVDFANQLRRVSVADTTVADILVINPNQLNLIARKPGFTTLAIWHSNGSYQERQVRVEANGAQQVLLNVVVAELNRSNLENQGVNYSAAFAKYGVSLVGLPGVVATPYSQQTQLSSGGGGSTGASTGAILPPGGNIIPLLLSQGMTYGISGQNSNVNAQGLLEYLETHNMARILAQPRLLANSGEKAKFLSGGEIPIVIAQALNTSVVFKQFGTSIEFLPTVTGRKTIELLVKPEVSEPDFSLGVDLFGFRVPAFITRRAETVVKLRDNQTLIMAGLILHTRREVVQKVPYLGDIPYLAGLFRNTNFQDVKSDLVMSVTPQIVRALPDGGQVYEPQRGQYMT
ncbi:MAG: type II and III secretion system protein family protein, partial [Candidatus Binataceae bacterium]